MKNQISRWIIFSLIVMVATTMTMKATPAPSNVGSATATVYAHIPLYIDPIIPTNHTGNIFPQIILRTGEPTGVSGGSVLMPVPFAVFGINGDKDAPIDITYSTHFLHTTGMSCVGQWALRVENGSTSTATTYSNLGGTLFDVSLSGDCPTSNSAYDSGGGVSMYAYITSITATADAEVGVNQLIFTVTAAYSF